MYEESDWLDQYLVCVYNAVLALSGNDIFPSPVGDGRHGEDWEGPDEDGGHTGQLEYAVSDLLLVAGAIINANIFGTIVVMVGTFNQKS